MTSADTGTRVRIFYPADPAGTIPGGVDTFIRGILRWAPEDIEISLVGVTTDPASRPVGVWTECDLGRRRFRFFPVALLPDATRQSRVPLSLRFTVGMLRYWWTIRRGFDVMEFHRIEPAMLFQWDRRGKNAFFHQNMQVLRNASADIRWKYLPRLYFWLEDWILPRFGSVFCVKQDAVVAYRERYPANASRFNFIPTWMDPEVFFPGTPGSRQATRSRLAEEFVIPPSATLIVTVGRLDLQKDPQLLVRAFAAVAATRPEVRLMFIGDGVLRTEIEALVAELGLRDKVVLAGLKPVHEVANLLRASDLFALSSAYEGMPMSLLEALGCGIPAVSTNVGEVARLIFPGRNGEIAGARTVDSFAGALTSCLDKRQDYRGRPCTEVARGFVPESVLVPVFACYRSLARAFSA